MTFNGKDAVQELVSGQGTVRVKVVVVKLINYLPKYAVQCATVVSEDAEAMVLYSLLTHIVNAKNETFSGLRVSKVVGGPASPEEEVG